MHLQFAFLADTATLSSDGKFNVLGGGLGVLSAQSFPTVQSILGLVVRVGVEQADIGQSYPFRIDLIGPSGDLITTLAQGPVQVPPRPEGMPEDVRDMSLYLGIVVTFPGITF